MKVLWITNNLLPRIKEELGIKDNYTCGWMPALSEALTTCCPDIHLGIAAVYSGQNLLTRTIDGIDYYCLPAGQGSPDNKFGLWAKDWKRIQESFNPDVIHIHGTEYPYGLAWLKSCGTKNVVVSIQGMVSVIERYRLAGIPEKIWNGSRSLIEVLSGKNAFSFMFQEKRRCRQEKEYISSVSHVIGRTTWDRIHAETIHPGIHYHFCNEMLRREFLSADTWELQSDDSPVIFMVARSNPIKGIHQAIRGMTLVLEKYPKATLRIAGMVSPRANHIRQKCYINYLDKLLRQTQISDHVKFLGPLKSGEMVKELQNANVFLCPSSIENSPNSLCEALLLGVPSVASYVGGVPDFIKHGENGFLYRFEEYEMMASYICELLGNKALCKKFSRNARAEALSRHDPHIITETMHSIYQSIRERK